MSASESEPVDVRDKPRGYGEILDEWFSKALPAVFLLLLAFFVVTTEIILAVFAEPVLFPESVYQEAAANNGYDSYSAMVHEGYAPGMFFPWALTGLALVVTARDLLRR